MEESRLDDSSPGDGTTEIDSQEARKQSIQRCMQGLVHASQCKEANCSHPSCQKMKRVVQHTKNCVRKTHGGCPICKQLIGLCCYHAKNCQKAVCFVPFCPNIKQKMKQEQLQRRLQQALLLRRRVHMMIAGMSNESNPMSSSSSADSSSSTTHGPTFTLVQPIQSPTMANIRRILLKANVSGNPEHQSPPAS